MEIRDAIYSGLQPSMTNISNELLKGIMRMCWKDPSSRPSAQMIAHLIAAEHPLWKIAVVKSKSPAKLLDVPQTIRKLSDGSGDVSLSSPFAFASESMLPFLSHPERLFECGGQVTAVVAVREVLWCCTGCRIVPVALDMRLQSAQQTECIKHQRTLVAIVAIPDSNVLVAGSVSGELLAWNLREDGDGVTRCVEKGKKVNKLAGSDAITHLIYAASHKLLIAADSRGCIDIWHYEGKRSFKSLGSMACKGPLLSMQLRCCTKVSESLVELMIVCPMETMLLPLDLFLKPRKHWEGIFEVWGKKIICYFFL